MKLHRFFCEHIGDSSAELVGSEAHHCASVYRLDKGSEVELFDGKGILAVATIIQAKNKKVTLDVSKVTSITKPTAPQITAAVSVAKQDRFELVIEKCTELGIDRVVPVIFERTVKQPKNVGTIDRWRRIAISAAKQSGRNFLPAIDNPSALTKFINDDRLWACQLLYGSLKENAESLTDWLFGESDVVFVVGPEGGLTEEESYLLQKRGAVGVQLTDTILRIETAALAFASVLTLKRTVLNKP